MRQNHSHIPFHQNVCHVVFHKEKEILGYKVHPNPHNFEKQMSKFKYITRPAFHRGYEGDVATHLACLKYLNIHYLFFWKVATAGYQDTS